MTIGDGKKVVSNNEENTIIVQRRAIRLSHDIAEGSLIKESDLTVLRPCPKDALPPYKMEEVIGKKINRNIQQGDYIRASDL